MKMMKYIFKWIVYISVHFFVFLVCILSKLGISKNTCNEFRASANLGAASDAYSKEEYDKCFIILKPYIEQENDYVFGGIKYQLAILYFYGKGVTLDNEKANSLFEQSAKLGWEDAKKYLSDLEVYKNNQT